MKRISAVLVPPITLDRRRGRPLYRQLYDWFRAAIIEGRMRPGQRVPSTRSVAAELQISRISVFNAYEQLQSEGYLETFAGSGTSVARTIPDDASGFVPPHGSTGSEGVTAELGRRMISARAETLLKVPSEAWLNNLGPFRVSLPALDQFPLDIWSKLVARHSRKLSRSVMAYGDAMGHLPFREAVADYLSTFRGVRCDSSQILVTTGSQQALQISAHVLLNAKDRVLTEEPGYPGARLAFTAADAELIPTAVDDEGMIVPEVNRRGRHARVAYVTPSHQYPMGVTMSAARRMSLLQWAVRTDAWIIEDDYDSEYRFGSRPIASLQGLDVHGKVIYIGTFSKGPVSGAAARLSGCSEGSAGSFPCCTRCRRHLFIHSLSGCLDRFHWRGTLRAPHPQNANALHGSSQGACECNPISDGRDP
ncbi:MAG TPA: PLP-dependent aminotransferase family protein [Terriglobales bacterium]|jgi:GntR family transcriptional regulator/MocR family aminotransferase|nr:PLP-dependent aminotransferase family protein [Terriglobales bacterium]